MHSGRSAEDALMKCRAIVVSAYRAFRYALHGDELVSWDNLPEIAQDGWLRVVVRVQELTENCENLAWEEIAREIHDFYKKSMGQAPAAWDHVHPLQRTAWQAVVRHILTLFEAEDLTEDTLDDMEVSWASWADKKNQQKEVTV